jgi:RNA polymerase sigma factor (sigma-70 family)
LYHFLTTKVKYSEEELVSLLRTGNQLDFSVLYDCYSRAILGIIKKQITDDSVAEDILQDVFVKIWNHRTQYNSSKGRLFTWMLNIARNASIDHLRSKQNRNDQQTQGGEKGVYEMSLNAVEETASDHIGFKNVLNHLTSDQRKLIHLVYYEGYTQEEISNNLKIPLGTVKTRIRSALITLRKIPLN